MKSIFIVRVGRRRYLNIGYRIYGIPFLS